MYNIHSKIKELCSTLWRAGYQHKLLRIFLHGIVVSSCEFIYSVVPGWTHLFYSLGYNPILIYFVAQIFALLASGTLSFGTCVPLTGFHHFGFFEALTFGTRLIVYISCAVVESAISPRRLAPFF